MTSNLVERIFPEMGVRLICINDEYDSSEPNADSSALTLPLKMVMNDYYVKDISQKIRSSIHAKMDNGEYLPSAGSIPYEGKVFSAVEGPIGCGRRGSRKKECRAEKIICYAGVDM